MADNTDLNLEALQADQAAQRVPQGPAPRPAPVNPVANQQTPSTPVVDNGPPVGQPIFIGRQGAQAPQSADDKPSSLWKTAGNAAWTSAVGMGSDMLSAASFAARHLTQSPEIVQHIEDARHATDDYLTGYLQSLPKDQQLAQHASLFGNGSADAPTPGQAGWAHYAAATIGSLLPQAAALLVPGPDVAEGASILARAGLAAAKAAPGAAVFGADQAGAAYKELIDGLDHASDKDMMSNPVYEHLRNSGMDEATAKQTLAGKAAPLILGQAAVGAAAGAGAGSLLTKGAMGAAGASLARRAAIGAGEGAATMGIQGGVGDYLNQLAQQQDGPKQTFDPEQTAKAFASGAIGGALFGAAGGALHGAPEAAPEASPHVASDVNQALQGELDLSQAKPGPTASGQGALFRSTDEANAPGATPGEAPAPPATPVVKPGPSIQDELPLAQPTRPGFEKGNQQGTLFADPTKTVLPTTPEPRGDVAAQVQALGDPSNPKDAMFIAKGDKLPGNLPKDAKIIVSKMGTLITTDADKAKQFVAARQKGQVNDELVGKLLNYTENKADVDPATATVVQGKDAQGNVVHEQAVNPENVPAAAATAAAHAPGGTVETATPEEVQARRAAAQPTHPVDVAAHQAVEPTPAQAQAGNFQKGHLKFHGLDMTIETPKGDIRKGPPDENGQPSWQAEMPGHYGYVKGTKGADGDHVDMTLGENAKAMHDMPTEQAHKEPVFVIDQIDPKTGKFDEHKAMVGYHTQAEAHAAYDKSFSDGSGPTRRGATNEMSFGDFKGWLDKGNTKKAISYKPGASKAIAASKGKVADHGVNSAADALLADHPNMRTEQFRPSTMMDEKGEFHPVIDGKAEEVKPVANEQTEQTREQQIEAEARAGRDRFAAMKKQMIKDAQTAGHPLSEVVKQSSVLQRNAMLEHPEWFMTDDQIKHAVAHLKTLDDIQPEHWKEAEAATRPVERIEGKRKYVSADVEDKLAETGGKMDADEAETLAQSEQADDSAELGSEATTGVEGEETSAGVANYEGGKGDRSKQTTNLNRPLADLEKEVLAGRMTAKEAHDEFGVRGDKETRIKAHQSFENWLKNRIAKIENPKLDDEYVDLAKQQLTAKGKEYLAIGRKMKALEKVRDTDAGKLKEALGELQHTFRMAEFARVMQGRDIRSAVWDKFNGERASAKDMLSQLADDPTIREQAPQAAALARRLANLVHDEVRIEHSSTMDEAGTFTQSFAAGTGDIRISTKTNDPLTSVLHEALHSVTSHYLEALPEDHPDMKLLRAIRRELRESLNDRELPASLRERIEYATQDVHELHTMLMSEPALMEHAATLRPSMGFKNTMRSLGYPLQLARSVWTAFTALVRKAVGLKGPVSEANASLLDHVMRPLQDIADRAVEFNKTGDVHQELATTVAHAMPMFDKAKDVVADRIDPATLKDKAYRPLLSAVTSDGMVKWNGDLFQSRDKESPGNSLKDWRKANEAVASVTSKYRDEHMDNVREMLKGFKVADKDKLQKLMVEATLGDYTLGRNLKADANAHVKPADRAELNLLQSRFDALSDKAKGTYEAVRDHYAKQYATTRDAELRSLIKTILPDADQTQMQKITVAARTKGGLEKLAKDASDPFAQSFGQAWETKQKLIAGIGRVHDMGFVKGDYFPLRRQGDYVVHYGEKGTDSYGMEKFERISQAEARRAELLKQGADPSPVLRQRESKMRDAMPTTVADDLARMMEADPKLKGHAEAARDLLMQLQMQHATRSEGTRTRLRRKGVQGASENFEQVIAKDFLTTSSRLGYLEHGGDRTRALSAMQAHADWLGRNGTGEEQRRAQAVVNEAQQRLPSGDDASGAISGFTRKLSGLGFVQSLMSPSHMLTSTIEAHMNSTSLLGARHGLNAQFVLAKALADITPAMTKLGAANSIKGAMGRMKARDWNLAHDARDKYIAKGANAAHMNLLFGKLDDAGLVDHTAAKEMERIAKGYGEMKPGYWQRFMDLNAAGAHAVDVANKSAIAKAAFDLEFKKTKNAEAAAEYAVDVARQAMPNYNLSNKARVATDKGPLGAIAAPLFQFKNYGLHMYSMMGNLLKASIHGASSAERMEARKAFAGILATHALMAGSLTLIADPLRYIGGAYDFITGADKPHDYENDVRRFITAAAGPEIGEIVARGLPHAAGIDLHRRIGLSNLLEVPELNSFDKKGFGELVAAAMTGAGAEDAATMAGGLSKMLHGDMVGGLKDMVPRVFRDPIKAGQLATTGVTDSKGKTILPADKLSSGDVARQALGFQPSDVSEFREARAAVLEKKTAVQNEHNQLLADMVKASGDDRAALAQKVRAFNQANPGAAITYDAMLKAMQRAQKEKVAAAQAKYQTYGLNLGKNAKALSEAGDFANTK